jgi:excisionase family DNA binding protein
MALMTTEEAAKYLGYSEYTLRQSRSTGLLGGMNTPKFIRLGQKSIRYKEEDLKAWVDGMETGGGE